MRETCLTIVVKFSEETPFRVKRISTVRELKKRFCDKLDLDISVLRFFWNGERLEDDCFFDFLDLNNGDAIEAFKGCSGGGPPSRKHQIYNEKQIQDALNESSEDFESDTNNSNDSTSEKARNEGTDEPCSLQPQGTSVQQPTSFVQLPVSTENLKVASQNHPDTLVQLPLASVQLPVNSVQLTMTSVQLPVTSVQLPGTSANLALASIQLPTSLYEKEKMKDPDENIQRYDPKDLRITHDGNEICREGEVEIKGKDQKKEPRRDDNGNQLTNDNDFEDNDNMKEIEESKNEDDLWLKTLRIKVSKGEFLGKSNLHKQIRFYLKLPQLTKCEESIVKTLVERIEILSAWEIEKESICPTKEKKKRKRQRLDPVKTNLRCQRRKTNNSNQNDASHESDQNIDESLNVVDIKKLIDKDKNDDISNSTPNQRKNVFSLFGIVSPFLRQKVPTEAEVNRFSLAVHVWAEQNKGGVKFLQETQLTERHFKEILLFAGPSSTWKLIPDRSVTQYLNLWKNATKGNQHFHGDPETGFQSKLKLHDPSIKFCPFEHCKLNSDMINKPSNKFKHESQKKITDKTYKGKLFVSMDNSQSSTSMIGQEEPKESPTKDELKAQNKLLKQQIIKFTNNLSNSVKIEDAKKEAIHFTQPKIVKCNQTNCSKTFVSVFGLEQHLKKVHGDIDEYKKQKQECPFCGKETVYINQHIKTVHKEMIRNDICEVCKQVVKNDMKKHRSLCIFCPFCGYENRKKDRLLKHIETHHRETYFQTEPMDLTSPRKEARCQNMGGDQKKIEINEKNDTQAEALDLSSPNKDDNKKDEPLDLSPHSKYDEINLQQKTDSKTEDQVLTQNKEAQQRINDSNMVNSPASLSMMRKNYPFDSKEDPYASEFEDEDEEEFTLNRRKIKDEIEIELREIDKLKSKEEVGDLEVLEQFELFMRNKTNRNDESKGYSWDVSTVGMYTRAIRTDILPAFHQLFKPFDARWILDCTSHKECTFEGEQRSFVKPEEPIYITSKIVQTALDMSKKKGGQQGGQRGTILNATIQFMNFIEIYFNQKLNLYGRDPYENVRLYHEGVKTFISGTGLHKVCNDEKDKAQNENRVRHSYQHPNKEVEVLQRYKTYINSPERLSNINKILIHSDNEEKRPSDGEMTELGKIAMGEIVAATGCRPVVLLKLTNGAYVDKQPGFNPYEISKDDCIVDEEDGNDKIFRRVNPNLPPKHKACKHQLAENKAECPVTCDDRCEPDGYNIFITWDKTFGSKGPSYLHIPKELKHIMDIYDIKRIRYFKGRKSPFTSKEDWIHDDETPFFLTSACSPFKSLNLKHISEAMGIDVTAYNFRKIVSTWALSHASEEIRLAEEEALQHSLKVAHSNYMQNKQIKPQRLVQKYVEEESLFPEAFKKNIEKTNAIVKDAIKSTEEKRTKKRIENLLKKKEAYTILKSENRPLGPKHRILVKQRKRFLELMKEIKNSEVESCLTDLKPLQWRQFSVRAVCTAKDEQGRELKELWKQIYKGDLKWGIRDARLRAEAQNWPRNQVTTRRDRNSWIAAGIRHCYYLSEKTRLGKKKD